MTNGFQGNTMFTKYDLRSCVLDVTAIWIIKTCLWLLLLVLSLQRIAIYTDKNEHGSFACRLPYDGSNEYQMVRTSTNLFICLPSFSYNFVYIVFKKMENW